MRVPGVPYVQGRNDYTDSDGKKYGIAIHNTSNDASDEGEASYATRRTDGISSHFYVDDDSVTQSIDTDDRVGHAGSKNGNENAIAFEITGGNGMSRSWWLANVAWDKMAQVIAYMLKRDPDLAGFQIRRASVAEMKANPKIKAFYGHDDMRQAWGGTTHTDPGPNFPWDKLISSVKAAMGGGEDEDMTPEEHTWLKAVHTALTRLDGREPIGQAYLRLAVGQDDTADAKPVDHPSLISLGGQLAAVRADLAALAGRDLVDESEIASELAPAVLAQLTPERIVAAIPATLARQVVDELSRRIAASDES